jgi:uncharacterized protein (DUF58 family)
VVDFIPAEVRTRLKGLRLATRRAVGSHGLGAHQSHSRGAGLEFAQYRAYEPGDELRQIDWKLYARSDKFFVREAERESPVAVWILMDASASMAQADAGADYSRFDAARGLAQSIAELALAQGDRFGWIALNEAALTVLSPASGARQRDRLLLELNAARAEGGFIADHRLGPLWERIGARDLVIVLSDGFEPGVVALIERLAAAGREVVMIEMLTVGERDFPYTDGRRFRDPETGEELRGDGPTLRAEFLRRFGEARAALHGRLDAVGVRHVEHVLDQPLDQPLRRLFGRGEGE